MYANKSGQNVDDIVFYFVFGVFKIAVIVQQIFYRHIQVTPKDPRFKHLDKIVSLYGLVAQQAIQKRKLPLILNPDSMETTMKKDLEDFRLETRKWLEENCPPSMRKPMKDASDYFWGGRNATFQ